VVDSLLAQFLTVPQNVLNKATLSATQPVIFSACHKLLFQQFVYNIFVIISYKLLVMKMLLL